MQLACRFLKDVSSQNSWTYTTEINAYEAENVPVYLQLVDLAAGTTDGGPGGGRRFCPAAGATLSVLFDSVDAAKAVTKVATQPFAGDASVWLASVLAGDKLRGTVTLRITLNETGTIHNAVVENGVRLRSTQRS